MDVDAATRRTNRLKRYLEIADRLHEAAEAVLNYRLTEAQAAEIYRITADDLSKKIKCVKFLRCFDNQHRIYTRAVPRVLRGILTEQQAVLRYRADLQILRQEIEMVDPLDLENYAFNRPINYNLNGYWWYRNDEAVLQELINWHMQAEPDMRFTQIAIYEHISRLAYHHARSANLAYPEIWNAHQKTTVKWLKKFDMRHHDRIQDIFGVVEIE